MGKHDGVSNKGDEQPRSGIRCVSTWTSSDPLLIERGASFKLQYAKYSDGGLATDLDPISRRNRGIGIGVSSMENGAGSGQDGEPGGPVQAPMSDVDMHGDVLSPVEEQFVKEQKEWLKSLTPKFINGIEMVPGYVGEQLVEFSMVPTPSVPKVAGFQHGPRVITRCPCGNPYEVNNVVNDGKIDCLLTVEFLCTGCGARRGISVRPHGDDIVGHDFDAVRVAYFKKAESDESG
jgi:hypothetical protein